MIIEIATFRLAEGASVADAVSADKAVQEEFTHHQLGFVRRTTARRDDGEWLVVTLWGSHADADRAAGGAETDSACQRLRALIDEDSVDVRRYTDLEG